MAVDFDNIAAARQLASAAPRGPASANRQRSARCTSASRRSIPTTPARTACLAGWRCRRNEPETAAREFRAVLALGPVDRAAALTDLAESYLKAGKTAEAKKETLAALEIAPSYERAQGLLLELVAPRP